MAKSGQALASPVVAGNDQRLVIDTKLLENRKHAGFLGRRELTLESTQIGGWFVTVNIWM
ncbi:MAG: hypothetical protein HOW73_09540 [Polyangiaceae bacterium]|nr:hypothetical protein [Polyangiaceae bacterium]